MKAAIIGGGAAGLMAAVTMLETCADAEIFLLEKNDSLGKKILISGGGRCNVTTGIRDIRTVLARYPRGGKFLTSAMHRFSPDNAYDWFESHGVPLKTEEDLRVFPQSNNGKDVLRAFEERLHDPRVHVLLKTQAVRIEKRSAGFEIFLQGRADPLVVDKLILATGGQAYRHTGSTGDGYAFAESLGHSVTPLAPGLSALSTMEKWPANVSGLSFPQAKIIAKRGKKPSFVGPFLFTHKGVSGPAVFALSSIVAFEPFDAKHPLEIAIDLFPDLSADALRRALEAHAGAQAKKRFANILSAFIPKSLADIMCRELALPEKKRAAEIGKKEFSRTAAWLKEIPLRVIARGAGDEFVTAGGVSVKEVDPTTMQSKICPGLYFAGEILDVDGFTGGFNLQASWTTGHLAGTNC